MLAEERFAMILDLLAQKRSATVLELCDALDASESTIRRDLTQLDRQGLLKKVHGGATLVGRTVLADEPPMAAREEQSVEEKRLIARAAAAMITEKDFIFLDAGSTTLALAAALEGPALQAAYVTNGIAHARMLVQKGCRTYLPGGQVRPDHGGIYHIKLCVIHQKPAFPRALQCGGFDAGFLRVRRGKALRRAYAVGTHKRFGKVVVL